MARCTHTSTAVTHAHGRALCFECFRTGMERTRARREAWAQRTLPFEDSSASPRPLSEQAIAHRQRMLDYLASTVRRGA
jgi:hypothetical protein